MLERAEQRERDERAQHSTAQDRGLVREIEVPKHIQDHPLFQQILQEQRALQARLVEERAERFAAEQRAVNYQGLANQARIEAADAREENREAQERFEAQQDPAKPGVEGPFDPYEKAADELDAKPMQQGQDIEGEVIEVAKVDGANYYVVEHEGERVAVPAGAEPEYREGDEITASRTKEGFETGEAYGYGR